MLKGHLRHGRRLGRYASDRLVDPQSMLQRHEEIVREMNRRNWPSGKNHQTPLDLTGLVLEKVHLDLNYNRLDLMSRCQECRKRIDESL